MEKLRELHEMAKNHPFRTDRIGSSISYGVVLDKLGKEFIRVLKLQYNDDTIPPYPFHSKKGPYWMWEHQFWGNVLALKHCYKNLNLYIDMIEFYLNTFHSYVEKGTLEFFYIDFGYTENSNSNYVWNPKQIYKIIYYSDVKQWDFDVESAKKALPIWEHRLVDAHAELKRHIEKHGDSPKEARWRQYIYDRIERDKKRIKRLKTIIKTEVKEV